MALALAYAAIFLSVALFASRGRGSVWILLAVSFFGAVVSISRTDLNTGDLPVYVEGFSDPTWSLYYLREAPFWFVGRTLLDTLGDPRLVFMVLDAFILWSIVWACGGRLGYAVAVVLFSFPTVLGFTNIYRQLIATVLVMRALAYLKERRLLLGAVMVIAACATHIAMVALALILLAIYLSSHRILRWPIAFCAVLAGIALYRYSGRIALEDLTGGTENRGSSVGLYVAMGLLLHSWAVYLLIRNRRALMLELALAAFFFVGAVSVYLAPASTGTRVMMISIHLCAFLCATELEKQQWPDGSVPLQPVVLLAGMAFPIWVSESAWHLLFGYDL